MELINLHKPNKTHILTELKQKNPQIRALAYHLNENNGVVKREEVTDFLKKISHSDQSSFS